jgi:hypothetical protein
MGRRRNNMAFDPVSAGFDFASKIIDKIFPDKTQAEAAKLRIFELQQQGGLAEAEHEFQLMIKQIEVNAIEAGSGRWWVSGWRPFIGWISGTALAWNYVIFPFYSYTAKWISSQAPNMYALDTGELISLLIGILGLGAYRTYEKSKGNA